MRGCVNDDCRLWVSDGTPAGTVQARAARPGPGPLPLDLTYFAGRVYAVNQGGQVVWSTAPSPATRLELLVPGRRFLRLWGRCRMPCSTTTRARRSRSTS